MNFTPILLAVLLLAGCTSENPARALLEQYIKTDGLDPRYLTADALLAWDREQEVLNRLGLQQRGEFEVLWSKNVDFRAVQFCLDATDVHFVNQEGEFVAGKGRRQIAMVSVTQSDKVWLINRFEVGEQEC